MEKTIKKRDGKVVPFDIDKVVRAAQLAYKACDLQMTEVVKSKILDYKYRDTGTVEEVNDALQNILYHWAPQKVYDEFLTYRASRTAARNAIHGIDDEIGGVIDGTNKETTQENANKNAKLNSTKRDLSAGSYSRGYARRNMLPPHIMKAHDAGLIHFHDLDYALIDTMQNCGLPNIYDMLWNGTVINGKMIERPHSIQTAATIASQIILQISNNQYGGTTINLSHLTPWVDITRQRWIKKYKEDLPDIDESNLASIVEKRTWEDIMAAMQTIQYQLNTFSSLNGQSPFVSIFMWIDPESSPQEQADTALLIKATLIQRRKGIKNEKGQWSTPAFPKLLFCLDENNMWPNSPYYDLKKLAIDSTIHRMNPDYLSAKMMRKYYEGNVFGCMGCRSMLAPWKDENGQYKFWGRWNRGVITVNIPDAALTAKQDGRDFFSVLDERLELCRESLKLRDSWVRKADTDNSPIHWKYGAYARLKDGETVESMCDNGYSTISLGYIGLSDAVYILTGKQINDPEGQELALTIMKHLRDWTLEHKKEPGLAGLSLYGTPAESLCYKFARTIMKRFGEVPGVASKDKPWLTNSYHISPLHPINAFDKIKFESELQALSLGGSISYVELPTMHHNPRAVEALIDAAYDQLIYFECNTRDGDQCLTCGFEGAITPDEQGNWRCPVCGEIRTDKLIITRRVCGYISSFATNAGKTKEIQDRVLHL